MYEYILPIGSVVKVKNVAPRLMVFGILQKSKTSDLRYDYIATAYPEGQYDPALNIGFKHEDIEEVVFKGFEDDDRKAFIATLEIIALREAELKEENNK